MKLEKTYKGYVTNKLLPGPAHPVKNHKPQLETLQSKRFDSQKKNFKKEQLIFLVEQQYHFIKSLSV